MAILKKGSVLKKPTGDEIIASYEDVHIKLLDKVLKSDLPIQEDSFSPSIRGGTTLGNQSYSIREGYYILVGDMVFINIYIALLSKDPAMSGELYIYGLPFPSYERTALNISRYSGISNVDANHISAIIANGANYISVFRSNYETGNRAAITSDDVSSSLLMAISGAYIKG